MSEKKTNRRDFLFTATYAVEGLPKPVKENIDKEEAEAMKKALEEVGGKVELK